VVGPFDEDRSLDEGYGEVPSLLSVYRPPFPVARRPVGQRGPDRRFRRRRPVLSLHFSVRGKLLKVLAPPGLAFSPRIRRERGFIRIPGLPALSGASASFARRRSRGPALDAVDINRRDEGQLHLDPAEELLPDELSKVESLGLIGDAAFGENPFRPRQDFVEQALQNVQVRSLQGRDGNDFPEGMEVLVLVDQGQQPVLANSVHLVDEQEGGLGRPAENLQDVGVSLTEAQRGVDEQADDVGRLERRVHVAHHPPVELVEGLVDAGVVDEDYLAALRGLDAQEAETGRLGLVRDDGDLLSQQAVEERGLADVRPADESHVPCPGLGRGARRGRGALETGPFPGRGFSLPRLFGGHDSPSTGGRGFLRRRSLVTRFWSTSSTSISSPGTVSRSPGRGRRARWWVMNPLMVM